MMIAFITIKSSLVPLIEGLCYKDMGLNCWWEVLALTPVVVSWDNTSILEFWRVKQHKVAAFASGLHVRLGAVSQVLSLNDVAIVLITNEVIGGWSLLKL